MILIKLFKNDVLNKLDTQDYFYYLVNYISVFDYMVNFYVKMSQYPPF